MRKVLKYNLKALMADKGIMVNEVAILCRKSRQTISVWINADINSDIEIKFSHLQKIAQLLEVDVQDLIKNQVAA